MTWLEKLIASSVIAILLAAGLFTAGMAYVQKEWDKDKAINKALLEQKDKDATDVVIRLNDAWQKEKKNAETKAGRDYLARWLRDHGLLPDGSPVRSAGGKAPAEGSQVSDATGGEQDAGRGLAEFAGKCGRDANRLTDWQHLCEVQGCEVIE